ncbi:MAG: GNAT family N-acetyltransferase [Bacteroidetes bacterium]|nr:GNAT family N-acetyltransferase [Bacteroidota bacterium]
MITKELTSATWKDFEKLFGLRGACGGCWCMAWRLKNADFEKQKGDGNKSAMKSFVKENKIIGIIGYIDSEPVGWCSVAPREDFIKLKNSRVLKSVNDEPVWSVTCLFMAKNFRKIGLSSLMLKAAVEFAKSKEAKIVEGYPVEPYSENIPAAFAWTGIPSAFLKAGFNEVARRSKTRPIMRYHLE